MYKRLITLFLLCFVGLAIPLRGGEFSADNVGVLQVSEEVQKGNPTLVQEDSTFCCQKKYFWVAAAEIIALQVIPNYFNRHVADDTTADLSFKSWRRNIQRGFEWDPNAFSGNMFQHPYHGNVFYNSARSNGYDFWESIPFAFAGSFIWEMFGENNLGAINDWAMTSLGGITIGEALHRSAKMLRDNTAKGASRAFRELGGFLLDPVGGFNRAVRGEMSKVGPNPADRYPTKLRYIADVGSRVVGEGRLRDAPPATGYMSLIMAYGDSYEDYKYPFDAFRIGLQLNGEDTTTLGMLQVWGTLYGSEMKDNEKVQHVFTIDQMYDYVNNRTYEVGGQSFAFSLRSRWFLKGDKAIVTLIQPSVYVMSGIISEYTQIGDRGYDFGSGFGLRLTGGIDKVNEYAFQIGYRGIYSHTLNGTKGNQIVHFGFLRARYRIWRSVGIGSDYIVYMRDSYFKDFPDIHRRNPEFRLSISFFWNTI
jgi:hypothetical protein